MKNPSGCRLRLGLISLLLVLGTVFLYWPVGTFDFVGYDDPFYVINNPHIRNGLTWSGLKWAFGNLTSGFTYWHPMTWMAHMLDFQFFGLNAPAHHWMNVGYHSVNVVLLFFVLRTLTGATWQSAIVAGLFAWHPLQVESVAWVTERKNLLSTFFFLLTALAYRRYVEKFKIQRPSLKIVALYSFAVLFLSLGLVLKLVRPGIGPNLIMSLGAILFGFCIRESLDESCMAEIVLFYSLTLFFFALGLMSKPMLVTMPGLLLLLDFWPLNRVSSVTRNLSDTRTSTSQLPTSNLVSLLVEKIPFLILSLASAFITIQSHKEFQSLASGHQVPFGIRLANAVYSYVRYLKKMVWPNDLAAIYPFPSEWPPMRIVVCVLLLLAISGFAIAAVRKHPYILFGWLWFLIALVPVIGVVQAGAQAMADRFAYIPLIGLFIAIVWGLADLLVHLRLPKIINGALASIALAACCFGSRQQLPFWKNSIALFERALAIENENPIAQYNLGYAYAMQGKSAEAKKHFQEAIRISSDYIDAHNNLAAILLAEGKADEALAHYERALKADPKHALAHYNMAIVLAKQGRADDALKHYSAAVQNDPNNVDFQLGLANALGNSGRGMEALEHVMVAVRLAPNSPEANYTAGLAMMMSQRIPDALGYYEKAIKLKPGFAEAHYNLGTALAMSGKVSEAMPHFAEAAKLKPDFIEAHFSFGMALAEAGKKEEAQREYREALRIANNAGRKDLAEQIESRLSQP
jgi:tetratricopeptide (TPR) repeat protein